MAQDDNDFFLGYIDEVQSYIPIIKKGVEELQTASPRRRFLTRCTDWCTLSRARLPWLASRA